jgi:hypothetical protein
VSLDGATGEVGVSSIRFDDNTVLNSAAGGGVDDGDWAINGSNLSSAVSGNVGIGTSVPASRLTISRVSQAPAHQLELRSEGSIQSPNYDGIRFTQGVDGSTTLAELRVDYNNNGRPDMSFHLRDRPNMLNLQASSGNVGIGTSNPSSYLEVTGNLSRLLTLTQKRTDNGDAALALRGSRSSATTAKIASIEFRDFDADEGAGTDFLMARISAGMQDPSGQTGYLRFYTNDGGGEEERARIDKDGHFGIGIADPDAILHVTRDNATSDRPLVKFEDDESSGTTLTVKRTVGDGAAASFSISSAPGNASSTIVASTDADGSAGSFYISNPASSAAVIETVGNHNGLHGDFGGDVAVAGDLLVTGNISKGSGTFKIDHPLHPETKYLSHSFVESPDMMNVYNGNILCDAEGRAVVELPEWFEALNREFRYQLTCVGGFAQVYVDEEVQGNQFAIAGGSPGLKISWQLTGVRKDAFAEANRVRVEEDKPEHLAGYYLHPEAFGKGSELGVAAAEREGARK